VVARPAEDFPLVAIGVGNSGALEQSAQIILVGADGIGRHNILLESEVPESEITRALDEDPNVVRLALWAPPGAACSAELEREVQRLADSLSLPMMVNRDPVIKAGVQVQLASPSAERAIAKAAYCYALKQLDRSVWADSAFDSMRDFICNGGSRSSELSVPPCAVHDREFVYDVAGQEPFTFYFATFVHDGSYFVQLKLGSWSKILRISTKTFGDSTDYASVSICHLDTTRTHQIRVTRLPEEQGRIHEALIRTHMFGATGADSTRLLVNLPILRQVHAPVDTSGDYVPRNVDLVEQVPLTASSYYATLSAGRRRPTIPPGIWKLEASFTSESYLRGIVSFDDGEIVVAGFQHGRGTTLYHYECDQEWRALGMVAGIRSLTAFGLTPDTNTFLAAGQGHKGWAKVVQVNRTTGIATPVEIPTQTGPIAGFLHEPGQSMMAVASHKADRQETPAVLRSVDGGHSWDVAWSAASPYRSACGSYVDERLIVGTEGTPCQLLAFNGPEPVNLLPDLDPALGSRVIGVWREEDGDLRALVQGSGATSVPESHFTHILRASDDGWRAVAVLPNRDRGVAVVRTGDGRTVILSRRGCYLVQGSVSSPFSQLPVPEEIFAGVGRKHSILVVAGNGLWRLELPR
jgi:hypothetical protein